MNTDPTTEHYESLLGYKFQMHFENEKPITLNPKLLLSQKINAETVNKIFAEHKIKVDCIRLLEQTSVTEREKINNLLGFIERCEFNLQRFWGFKEDKRFHRFWELPHCTCPKLDNIDAYPHQQYYTSSCPLHGVEY